MRLIRPKGTTILSILYQKDLDNISYKKLINHIISHYTSNGFTYNGIPLSLASLSYYLQVKEDTFQNQVIEVSNLYSPAFRSGDLEVQSGLRASLFSQILTWVLSDKASMEHLKALVTNELQYPTTGNLKLPHAHLMVKLIESDAKLQASLINILEKAFPAKNTTNILAIQANQAPKADLITQKEAIDLIGESASLALQDPSFMAALAEEYGVHDPDRVPEVRAGGAEDKYGTFIKTSAGTLISADLDSTIYSIESIDSD